MYFILILDADAAVVEASGHVSTISMPGPVADAGQLPKGAAPACEPRRARQCASPHSLVRRQPRRGVHRRQAREPAGADLLGGRVVSVLPYAEIHGVFATGFHRQEQAVPAGLSRWR